MDGIKTTKGKRSSRAKVGSHVQGLTPALILKAANAYDKARVARATPVAAMRQALECLRSAVYVPPEHRAGVPPEIEAIIHAVFRSNGVDLAKAKKGTPPHTVRTRDEAVAIARRLMPELSTQALGKYFARDRRSLDRGQKRFEDRIETDDVFRARIEKIVGAKSEARAA